MTQTPVETKEERDARETRERNAREQSEGRVLLAFWSTLAAGAVTLILYAWLGEATFQWKTFAVSALSGGASALLGALLGFLFGLPPGAKESGDVVAVQVSNASGREESAPVTASRIQGVNNNLLEISNWLTKIIVGAGLVQLNHLVWWVGEVGRRVGLGAGLTGETAAMFGGALLIFFFCWGFLFVYIQTRTIISFIFASVTR